MADPKQEDVPILPGSFLPGIPGAFTNWVMGDNSKNTSYGAIEARRKIALALAAQKKGFPKNLGEGLTYFGEAVGERMQMERLARMEEAAQGRLAGQVAGAPGVAPTSTATPDASVRPQASLDTGDGDEAPVRVSARPSPATAYVAADTGGGDGADAPAVVADAPDIPVPAADPVARTVQIAASDPPPADPANPPYFSNPARPSLSTARYPLGAVPPQAFPRQPRLLPGQVAMSQQQAPPPPPPNQGLPPVSFDQTFQDTRGGVGVPSSVPPREEVAVADPADFNEIDAQAGPDRTSVADRFDALGGPAQIAMANPPPPRGDPRDRVALALAAQKEQAQQIAQAQAQQDVMGGYRGAQMPRTASLGREGVVSDAPTPGVTERGVAESAAAREAVTRALLQQQAPAPTPAPAVPSPDPTSGASSPPTTSAPASISEGASTSPVSPSSLRQQLGTFQPPTPAQYAQATIPPARTPGRSPTVSDIPRAPEQMPSVPSPYDVRPLPKVPPTVDVPPSFAQPMSRPAPPPTRPYEPEELYARKMIMGAPGDPETAAAAAQIAAPGAARRQQLQAQDAKEFDKKLAVWEEQQKTQLPAAKLAQQQAEQAAALKDEEYARFGPGGREKFEALLKENLPKIRTLPATVMAVNNVRDLLNKDPKMFTGSDAEWQTALAKMKSTFGITQETDPRASRTEQFKSFMSPLLAQMRSSIVGAGPQSEKELATLQQAVGSDPKLERGTINAILNSVERINLNNAMSHQKQLEAFTGGKESEMRIYNPFYGIDHETMASMVPKAAVNRLLQNASDPKERDNFNRSAHTPGLAEYIIGRQRR